MLTIFQETPSLGDAKLELTALCQRCIEAGVPVRLIIGDDEEAEEGPEARRDTLGATPQIASAASEFSASREAYHGTQQAVRFNRRQWGWKDFAAGVQAGGGQGPLGSEQGDSGWSAETEESATATAARRWGHPAASTRTAQAGSRILRLENEENLQLARCDARQVHELKMVISVLVSVVQDIVREMQDTRNLIGDMSDESAPDTFLLSRLETQRQAKQIQLDNILADSR
jgi:uncharacterized protein YhdP